MIGMFCLGASASRAVVTEVRTTSCPATISDIAGQEVEVISNNGEIFTFIGNNYKIGQGVVLIMNNAKTEILDCFIVQE